LSDEKRESEPELIAIALHGVLEIYEYGSVSVSNQNVPASKSEMINGVFQEDLFAQPFQILEKNRRELLCVLIKIFGHIAPGSSHTLHDKHSEAVGSLLYPLHAHEEFVICFWDTFDNVVIIVQLILEHVPDAVFFQGDHFGIGEFSLVESMPGQDLCAQLGSAGNFTDIAPAALGTDDV
jgi:hypothetical protein